MQNGPGQSCHPCGHHQIPTPDTSTSESTAHVAATESAPTTMSSGKGVGRNRHRADQQSRSSHNTKITLHENLQWFDQFTLIVHRHIGGSAVATIKLTFRKLNLILTRIRRMTL
jgi:hypothetical protein